MHIIRYSRGLRLSSPHAVAIGNFDGLHLGHQQLLAKLVKDSQALGLEPLVCSFHPLPWQWLASQRNEAPSPLLHNLRAKINQLQANKISKLVLVHFNESFRRLSPQQFIQDFLVKGLNTAHLITGADFRFGFARRGSKEQLLQAQRAGLFNYAPIAEYPSARDKIGSSKIRTLLAQGELAAANTLLGYDYYIIGRIIHGNKQGAGLGFPTANIKLNHFTPPLRGVFACRTYIEEEQQARPAVANLGYRPTMIDNQKELRFSAEAHLLNFHQDIYGKVMKLVFIKQLRAEKKFANRQELAAQIKQDVAAAKRLLG